MWLFNRKGQATTELAIFGSLILLCLASLLKYGQMMRAEQELKMDTFRAALRQSYEQNRLVTVASLKNMNYPDPLSPSGQSSSARIAASSGVLWSNHLFDDPRETDNSPRMYYIVNDEVIEVPRMETKRDRKYSNAYWGLKGVWERTQNGFTKFASYLGDPSLYGNDDLIQMEIMPMEGVETVVETSRTATDQHQETTQAISDQRHSQTVETTTTRLIPKSRAEALAELNKDTDGFAVKILDYPGDPKNPIQIQQQKTTQRNKIWDVFKR